MNNILERKINYYETDKMGIVHHSNYIRFLEEGRCHFFEHNCFSYDFFEEHEILIPVVSVDAKYILPVTFNDIILIETKIKKYTGVSLIFQYTITNQSNSNIILQASSKHCFTNKNLQPLNLKKLYPSLHSKFDSLI